LYFSCGQEELLNIQVWYKMPRKSNCKHQFISIDDGITWKCVKCGKKIDWYDYYFNYFIPEVLGVDINVQKQKLKRDNKKYEIL